MRLTFEQYRNRTAGLRVLLTSEEHQALASKIYMDYFDGDIHPLSKVLQNIYPSHKAFYADIFIAYAYTQEKDFKYGDMYYPSGTVFSTEGSPGFQAFIHKITGVYSFGKMGNGDKVRILKTIWKRISAIAQPSGSTTSIDMLMPVESIGSPEDPLVDIVPKLSDNLIVSPSGKTYRISLEKTNDIVFLKAAVKEAYMRGINAKYAVDHKEHIAFLKAFEKDKEKIKLEALAMGINIARSANWKMSGSNAVLSSIIYATHITKDDLIVEIPSEHRKTFFVKGLLVPLTKTSLNTEQVLMSSAFHPNAYARHEQFFVCLGDVDGKSPIEIMRKLPNMLKTINLKSAYENETEELAKHLFKEGEKIRNPSFELGVFDNE